MMLLPTKNTPTWIQVVSLQEPEEIELPLHESLSSFREMLSTGRVCFVGSRIGSVFLWVVIINTTKLVDVGCYMCFFVFD